MQAIMETIFEIPYLIGVVAIGSRSGTGKKTARA